MRGYLVGLEVMLDDGWSMMLSEHGEVIASDGV